MKWSEVKRVLAATLAAILESINRYEIENCRKWFLIPEKVRLDTKNSNCILYVSLDNEVKRVLAAILAAILETINSTKLKVAENDSSYPKKYV